MVVRALRNINRRTLKGVAIAFVLALGVGLGASPAHAEWHGHGWHGGGWHGGGWGGPRVVIGLGYAPPPVYYPPPPVYYYPPPLVVPPAPVVVQSSPSCTSGQWRQQDGSIVNGVACRQPDGTWQLEG